MTQQALQTEFENSQKTNKQKTSLKEMGRNLQAWTRRLGELI